MNLYTYLKLKYLLKNNDTFIWNSKKSIFKKVGKIKTIPLNLIIGVLIDKKIL